LTASQSFSQLNYGPMYRYNLAEIRPDGNFFLFRVSSAGKFVPDYVTSPNFQNPR
jgi:hypothetical protein